MPAPEDAVASWTMFSGEYGILGPITLLLNHWSEGYLHGFIRSSAQEEKI